MEISITKNGIRMKAKNYNFLLDSAGDEETDAVLISHPEKEEAAKNSTALIIKGPGEYEVAGVSVKGDRVEDGMIYDVFDDSKRILIFPSAESIKGRDTEGYNAALVYAKTPIEDSSVSDLSSELVILYADDDSKIAVDKSNLKKVEKINLKKIEDLKGSILFLTK